MPLAYILQNLQAGQSARRTTMGGYVEKSAVDAETGGYTLTWRKKDGTTTYVYTWTGTAWQAPSTTIPVDAEFFAMMTADDWQIVDTATLQNGTW